MEFIFREIITVVLYWAFLIFIYIRLVKYFQSRIKPIPLVLVFIILSNCLPLNIYTDDSDIFCFIRFENNDVKGSYPYSIEASSFVLVNRTFKPTNCVFVDINKDNIAELKSIHQRKKSYTLQLVNFNPLKLWMYYRYIHVSVYSDEFIIDALTRKLSEVEKSPNKP